jgi:hypothetical protein
VGVRVLAQALGQRAAGVQAISETHQKKT